MNLVDVDEQGPLLRLTLNRPEKRNAINDAMLATIDREVRRFAADPKLQVLLLRANGAYFSSGADLRSGLIPDLSSGSQRELRHWLREGEGSLSRLAEYLETIEKPTIAAHQGPCLGGALELSLACDFRLAAHSAHYRLPETAMGAIPTTGGTARLTRLVGTAWARWFLVAGQQVTAAKAEAIGLVHHSFEDDAFEAEVENFCTALAATPPEAVAAAKLAIDLAGSLDGPSGRRLEHVVSTSLVYNREFQNLMEAAQQRHRGPGESK